MGTVKPIINRAREGYHSKNGTCIQNLAGILIASAPILSPYTLYGINVFWILGAIFFIFCLFENKNKILVIESKYFAITGYALMAFILSINSLPIIKSANLINAMVGLLISLCLYIILWKESDFAITEKWLNIFCYICCAYMIYQIFMQIATGTAPLGKITFSGLDISTNWVKSTWGFRFNSLFSEPSYFAIYLLPIFALNIIQNRYLNSIIFGVSLLLSSSTTGLIVTAVIIIYVLMSGSKSFKNKLLYIGFGLIGIAIVCYMYFTIPSVASIIGRTMNKLSEVGSSDNSIRITGYIEYFDDLPVKEQLLGVGIFQLQNYFAQNGVQLANYSNSVVLTIIDLGIIGTLASILYFMNLYFHSKKNRSLLFYLILILIFCTDAILLSYRFFYLCYFVMFFQKKAYGKNNPRKGNMKNA